jgi:hypothetical protein
VSNLVTASERLVLSRERLCQAIREHASPNSGLSKSAQGTSASTWFDALKSIPGAPVLLQALTAWWAVHPLRVVCMSTAGAVKTVIQPLAQRHPIGLVAGAVVVGVLFVRSHPWRWLFKPALFAGLLPQILAAAAAQVPPQSWINVLTSLIQQTKAEDPVLQAEAMERKPASSHQIN